MENTEMSDGIARAIGLVKAGSSYNEASKLTDTSLAGVFKACRKRGIANPGKTGRPKQSQPIPGSRTAEALRLVAEGVKPLHAAQQVGLVHQVVYNALKQYPQPTYVQKLEAQNAELLAALTCISRGLTNGQKKRGETLQSIAQAAIAEASK